MKEEEVEEQEVVDVPKLLQATLLAGLYSRRFLRLGPGQLLPRKLKAGNPTCTPRHSTGNHLAAQIITMIPTKVGMIKSRKRGDNQPQQNWNDS